MSSVRIIFASMLSCILLLAGLLMGSIRPAHTADAPASRHPFTERLDVQIPVQQLSHSSAHVSVVPVGKTMYLEYVSGWMEAKSTRQTIRLFVECQAMDGKSPETWLLWPQTTEFYQGDIRMFRFSQPVGVHLKAGDRISAQMDHSPADNNIMQGRVNISGYLE